jgi:hypothetical protein
MFFSLVYGVGLEDLCVKECGCNFRARAATHKPRPPLMHSTLSLSVTKLQKFTLTSHFASSTHNNDKG